MRDTDDIAWLLEAVCSLPTAHRPLPTAHHSLLVAQINPLNRSRSSSRLIHINDRAADAHFALRMIRLAMDGRREAIDDVAFLHSNHSAVTSRHPQVRQVGCAGM